MTEEAAKCTTTGWDVARVFLGLGNMGSSAFFMLIFGLLLSDRTVSTEVLIIQIVLLISVVVQFVTAVGLIAKRQWAGPALLVVAAAQVVTLAITVLFTKWWVFLPAIPAVATVGLLALPKFEMPLGPRGKDLGIRPLHVGLIVGGLAVLYLVSVEADYIAKELSVMRYESSCEDTGDPYDCRQAAMFGLRLSEDFDEMRELEARFAPLCEKGHAPACRSIGYVRSDYFRHLGPPRKVIRARIDDVSKTACLAGDGRACAVAGWLSPKHLDVVEPKAKELCAGGDRDACLVAVRLAMDRDSSTTPPADEFEAACKAGITAKCARPEDATTACLRGELDACADAKGADAAVYEALAAVHRPFGNPGIYGFAAPAGDHMTACEEGRSIACLVAGLELLDPSAEPTSNIPALPPREQLDATLGRACDDGLAIACLVYGFRLLDRGVKEDRDIAGANRRLNQGCELGSEAACRHVSFEAEIRKHDFDGYRKQLARSCARTANRDDCNAHVSFLAFELGATPWPITDDVAYVHLRHACERTGDAMACTNAAHFIHALPVTPEFQQTALSLGHLACQQSYAEGCQTLFWSAERWWPDHAEALREKICPHVPAACR